MLAEVSAVLSFLEEHSPGHALPASLGPWIQTRYQGHWHAEDPERGSAYRSLDRKMLPVSVRDHLDLEQEFVIWVDPGCVCARLSPRAPLTTIYGTLPFHTRHQSKKPSSSGDEVDWFHSPTRQNKAIAILAPSSKAAPALSVAPPTPASLVTSRHVEIHSPSPLRPSDISSPISRPCSAASSSGDSSSLFSNAHQRSFSSASSASSPGPSRPSSAQSVVKEHLNGKVGVLGGGILLGCGAEEEQHLLSAAVSDGLKSGGCTADDSDRSEPQQRRKKREHRGKRGSGKQAAKRALNQQAPRWAAMDKSRFMSNQRIFEHDPWHMPTYPQFQYAY